MRRKIVAGNWKMNNLFLEAVALSEEIIKSDFPENVELILAPPFPYLIPVHEIVRERKNIFLGGQNCHSEISGAYTGEVSAGMLRSCGAEYVIIGHSERRKFFAEGNDFLRLKLIRAIKEDLIPVFCIGEHLESRTSGKHFEDMQEQLSIVEYLLPENGNFILAYEPVWAIGTGLNASPEQAQEMHHFIRNSIQEFKGKQYASNISILYGGSCNPENAKGIFSCPDVDGGLIGGASLKAESFIKIANSF